jgi:4-diphosphocytidyl-2-C-methyl-D-erythritol kinase
VDGAPTTAPRLHDFARAKVNLTLRVLGRRPDGFHLLESLVVFADAADRLSLDPAAPEGLDITGPFADAIVGENLVARARVALAAAAPGLVGGHLVIEKNLPVAAGLGGGSADAAAALRLFCRTRPDAARAVDLRALALSLGADVPVCLESQATLVGGIGERLTPIPGLAPFHGVLANALAPASTGKTAAVFRALGAPARAHDAATDSALAQIRRDPWGYIAERGNDLEAPAAVLDPGIGAVRAALAATAGVQVVRLSGAGPTCVALYPTAAEAAIAAAALARHEPGWWVRAVTLS